MGKELKMNCRPGQGGCNSITFKKIDEAQARVVVVLTINGTALCLLIPVTAE